MYVRLSTLIISTACLALMFTFLVIFSHIALTIPTR